MEYVVWHCTTLHRIERGNERGDDVMPSGHVEAMDMAKRLPLTYKSGKATESDKLRANNRRSSKVNG
jgi:hypothetical protein